MKKYQPNIKQKDFQKYVIPTFESLSINLIK